MDICTEAENYSRDNGLRNTLTHVDIVSSVLFDISKVPVRSKLVSSHWTPVEHWTPSNTHKQTGQALCKMH